MSARDSPCHSARQNIQNDMVTFTDKLMVTCCLARGLTDRPLRPQTRTPTDRRRAECILSSQARKLFSSRQHLSMLAKHHQEPGKRLIKGPETAFGRSEASLHCGSAAC